MAAGASSTAGSTSDDRPSVSTDVPYRPRTLTRGEATSRETFVFYSPKNDRVVTMCDYLHLALALKLEFNPWLKTYVERPRKMTLAPKLTIDISFWTRDHSGHEQHLLAIPKAGTIGNARDGITLRDRTRLETAAQRHDLQLSYVLEQELLNEGASLRRCFLLLPHVQSSRRVRERITICHGIETYFKVTTRASFAELITAFPNFSPDHVVAVAATMIHDGALRLADTRPLSPHSALEVADGS